MNFIETKLKGAYIIELQPKYDERGFFARAWCQNEFKEFGLATNFVQCNLSFNNQKGILRGMHYQLAPHQEVKIVRCIRGAVYDVVIDLRQDSPTYKQWLAVELDATEYKMFYVPEGFAHGFQTLTTTAEVFYQVSEFYHPECELGIRWDDPVFSISWPETKKRIISEKDRNHPWYKA